MSVSRLFIIGTSAGGVAVVHRLLGDLSPEVKSPIVVVQHLPDLKHVDVKTVYPSSAGREVTEVEDKMPIAANTVYFAPGGYHLLIEKDETFSLSQDDPIRYSRPSIDLSFECAAGVFGDRLVAVVLTGANADGADGLRAVRERGGLCIVQDPATAEHAEMPRAAIAALKPDFIARAEELPALFRKIESGGLQ